MTHKSILASAVLTLGLTGAALAAAGTSTIGEASTLAMATITAADAVAAVESTSGGKVVQLLLSDRNGQPAYQVSVIKSDGTELAFLVDAMSGKVKGMARTQATAEAAGATDATETGEGPNDADSGNEDAN